jgi:hypothetical protein
MRSWVDGNANANDKISSEISLASASTVRAQFGCIFKATTDCAP